MNNETLPGHGLPSAPSPHRARQSRPARALASPAFAAGALLTLCIIAIAICAPVLAPYDPVTQDLSAGLQPPSAEHWFGTDQLGRDMLSRVLYAARVDLGIAVGAAIAPFIIGVTAGLLAGYFGHATDWVISRITDTVIAFPFYVMVIALVFAVGAGPKGIIVAFAVVGWVGYARVIRAMTATQRQLGWVRAARGAGLSDARVLIRHILPNVLPQAIVLLTTEIILIMVAIVTLGYLGLGIQPPTPDWGTMIADGQAFVTTHWWLSTLPGLAVVITGISLSLLGDGIGDAMRIRQAPPRSAHAPIRCAGVVSVSVARGHVRVRDLRVASSATGAPIIGGATGINIELQPGEALGIVGESGSGKSLTLRAILGLLPVGVEFGAMHTKLPTDRIEVSVGGPIGMVFQDPATALDPLARVGSQVLAACKAAGAADPAARTRELLAAVQLPDEDRIARSFPHELSGGQRQRIVIAIALAGDPAVLLCDEPTTALDVTVQREVLALLTELRRERGLTLVFVSHDLAVVAEVCDRIAVMYGGDIVEEGTLAEVISRPQAAYTQELLAAVPDGSASPAPIDPAAETVLTVADLTVKYGAEVGAGNINFALKRGEVIGIVGESGSGKTTVARALVGELPLSAGRVTFCGAAGVIDPGMAGRARIRAANPHVQLVPQDPAAALNPRLTVGSVLIELVQLRGRETGERLNRAQARARAISLLAEVGLDSAIAGAYPHEISGGQRQRVAIARALAVEPEVLVADEATSALDVSVQAGILALLERLRLERGLAMVFVSHDLAVVREICSRVLVMQNGAIVESGGEEFFAGPRTAYGRELLAAVPMLPRG